MAEKLPDSQWGLIACLLSLDAVGPFHEDMGLAWPDKLAFIRLLRETIVKNRHDHAANPGTIISFDRKLMPAIESGIGSDAADKFDRWARGTFKQVHADQPEWSAWHLAFFRWVFGRKNNDLLAVSRVRPSIESRFKELADTAPLEEKFEEVKSQPLSHWDLEMCAIHGFSPDDDSGNFFDIVSATFEIRATQLFIPELAPKLDDREKRWLHAEAKRMIGEMKVWMPGPLPELDEMVRRAP